MLQSFLLKFFQFLDLYDNEEWMKQVIGATKDQSQFQVFDGLTFAQMVEPNRNEFLNHIQCEDKLLANIETYLVKNKAKHDFYTLFCRARSFFIYYLSPDCALARVDT